MRLLMIAAPGGGKGTQGERLAAYKYPRRVWLPGSLPKGATGKILRREVAIPPEVTQT